MVTNMVWYVTIKSRSLDWKKFLRRLYMAIESIDILNIMVFRRQWRKNNGDCKQGEIKEGDKLSDGFHLDF